MTARERTRTLTREQVERAGLSESLLEGKDSVDVGQAWAARIADRLWAGRCTSAAVFLLPRGWAKDVYEAVRLKYWRAGKTTWNRVSWAVFAAAYVEAGR